MRRREALAAGLALAALATARPLHAAGPDPGAFIFASISGGTLDLADFQGGPVLVVNTASRCAFTGQYDALQALHDRYRARGLTVVGVPSNSFRQELGSDVAVKSFCAVNFEIDFPMTGIVEVTGPQAHPFYRWAQAQGVAPRWNFHKILLDGDGRLIADFSTATEPDAPGVIAAIEALLPRT